MTCGAQRSLARAFEIDDVDERGEVATRRAHELFYGLAKDNALVVALFESYGVVTEKVEGGDHLHSSELAY